MKGNRDHRLQERAAAIGLRACRRSGHCRQTRLKVEACKFRMCQFFWWGSPCTGQSTGGGPYLFFRSPEPLPGEPILRPLAGLYKTRNSHLAGNSSARGFPFVMMHLDPERN